MVWDFDLTKSVLSLLGVAGSTASGVAALLVDFKDKQTGRVTKWGKLAIWGLSCSFLINAISLSLEYWHQKSEAQEAAQKTLKLLNEIDRSLNPIKEVTASFRLQPDFDHPDLAGWKKRFDSAEPVFESMLARNRYLPGILELFNAPDDTAGGVEIGQTSPLYPKRKTEAAMAAIAENTIVDVYLFKQPIQIDAFLQQVFGPDGTFDLNLSFEPSRKHPESIEYIRVGQRQLYIAGHAIPASSWRSSGNVVSTLDLLNAQIWITTAHPHAELDGESADCSHPAVLDFELTVGDRRPLSFKASQMKHFAAPNRGHIYMYQFPSTTEELTKELEH
jgi:hypothetical protein